MTEKCAGGVKLDFKKRCHVCGAGPGDQCAKAALRDFEERQALIGALKMARARIEYLGLCCLNSMHFESNENEFLPKIDKVLDAVSSQQDTASE